MTSAAQLTLYSTSSNCGSVLTLGYIADHGPGIHDFRIGSAWTRAGTHVGVVEMDVVVKVQ